jgi:hypothetical protein
VDKEAHGRYRVFDSKTLGQIVDYIIETLGAGSDYRAAIALSASAGLTGETGVLAAVSRSTLRRLWRAKHPTIDRNAFDNFVAAVEMALPKAGVPWKDVLETRNALYDTVTEVGADAVRRAYVVWTSRYVESFPLDGGDRMETVAGRRERVNDAATIGWRRRWDAVSALRAAYERCPRILERFARELVAKRLEGGRVDIAFLRLVEPLIHSAESGFVERHWSDLETPEWRDFLDAGVLRELILLDREEDETRINMVAAGDHLQREERSPTDAERETWADGAFSVAFQFQANLVAVTNEIFRAAHRPRHLKDTRKARAKRTAPVKPTESSPDVGRDAHDARAIYRAELAKRAARGDGQHNKPKARAK